MPSIAPESFGLTAAESMAARRPLLVSDAGALPEVVGSDYPWIVPSGDVAAWAEAIERALAADWNKRCDSSYRRWSQHFSPSAGRDRLAAVLDKLARHERQ